MDYFPDVIVMVEIAVVAVHLALKQYLALKEYS
jgi:hypothetical protein